MFEYESMYFDGDSVEGRALDIFVPGQASRETALFFVHGGGWRSGSRGHFHPLMRAFNREGFTCASTDYRLRVNALEQLTDVRHGYGIFHRRLRESGRSDRVFVIGSSAGAHLALLMTLTSPGQCGEAVSFGDQGLPDPWVPPVGAALQSTPVRFEPWDDMFPPIWDAMQNAAGVPYAEDPERYRALSPLNHISDESPPIFFLEAENEHMFPHRYTVDFAEKMTARGRRAEYKIYPGVEHGFFYGLGRGQQREAFADVCGFIADLERG